MRAVRRRRRPRQGPPTVVERWKFERGRGPGILHLATWVEADLHRGQVAGRAAVRLKVKGFTPDLIIAHAGWGATGPGTVFRAGASVRQNVRTHPFRSQNDASIQPIFFSKTLRENGISLKGQIYETK
ncbi:hypothetical protein CSW58_01715 [Caulobacter sp. B11]|uniref:hypothetical protein n=1 Tax=Caulobacter sp. B11 TaxID=2048899 RepID=UPI000C12A402|nr:hypothetical protein CSW58_01715 [Caulobacter sp. B11]